MAKAAAKPRTGRGGSSLWLQGLVCGVVLTFATPAALLACVLLAPALLASIADRSPGRPVVRAVLLYGTAVALKPLWHLCLTGDSMDTALAIMSDPMTIGACWLGAALGWALCEVLPFVLETAGKFAEAARVLVWETELKRCREEWGE